MHRVTGKLGLAAAVAFALTAVTALDNAALAQSKQITVWMNGDKAYTGMAEIGKRFEKDTGVKVVVEHPEDATGKFQQAAASGKGPDIFLWAHDRMGEWVQSGLLEEIKPEAKLKKAIEGMAWDAWTSGGKLYGYPIALEAVALVCNKKLVPKPPKTFEEIFELHKKMSKDGKKALLWAYTTPYFTFPLLAANGGYVFKRKRGGVYETSDVGVNNAGALRGAQMLRRLIDEGVMPKGAGYDTMETAMHAGELGCMINGPWSWGNLGKNNIDFSISPLPSINGKPARPFVGVLGAMINRASANKELAKLFLEKYVLTAEGLKTLDDDVSLGVPAHKAFYRTLSGEKPLVRQTMLSAKNGILMPATPKMGAFWSAMESAFQNITNQRQTPKEALDAAARRIKG
ncbi:maltose/maltodextrin ABC transporter substrate-binding protein MalE [Haliangium sp.]|uniref:maltose/maltodextrin ABC transporter substrate-binding protein MalE n=1 Tax=Haliangium sp. TaxID=2663208 RepID=UPI003D0FC3E5